MLEAELAVVTEENLIPAWSMIELTHRCNLKCSHCYIPREARKANKAGKARTEKEVEQRCKYLTINPLRNPPGRKREAGERRLERAESELTTKEVKNILNQLSFSGIYRRGDIFKKGRV